MPRRSAKNDSPRRAVGYIRVSELGGRSGPELHTIDVQQASIERACAAHGLELLDVLTEVNRSGADADRPIFREAMRRIQEGEVNALVVWKVSRFSRDLGQAVVDARAIERAGGDLIAGDEPFDTASPQGTLMLHMLLAFADYEREVLKEQWEGIKRRVIERGSHLGRTPIGYLRYAPEPTKPWHLDLARAKAILREWDWNDEPQPGMLIPDPDVAPVVREIFEQRANGASWADLTRLLDAKAPRGPGMFHGHSQVKRMVQLRVYLGEVGQAGETIAVHNRNAHPALVDLKTWLSVQTIEKGRVKRADEPFLLSGLVYCAGCSYRMGGGTILQPRKVWASTGEPVQRGTRTDRYDADAVLEVKKKVRVYRCPGKRGSGRCPAQSVILAEPLEDEVKRQLAPLLEQAGTAEVDYAAVTDELQELDRQIAEADEALLELASLEMKRSLGDDWSPMMRRLRAEKAELLQAHGELGAELPTDDRVAFSELDEQEREVLLRSAISAVFVRRAPRGTSAADRIKVLRVGDELPPLGGPRNRIAPTHFRWDDSDPGARVA